MKNAALFHGTGGTPNSFWQPYIKEELEKREYQVWSPQLPDTNNPEINKWLSFALQGKEYNKETVLIGHSAGCPLILSILENITTPIRLAILVAAFSKPLDNINKEPILQNTYNWEKIKNNAERIIIINSDNDPWGCNIEAGMEIFKNTGGELIIRHGEGHMGSNKFNQPYKEFPLLIKLIEVTKWN